MSITGNLRTLEISELLQWLAHGRKSGALLIEREGSEMQTWFDEGRIIGSASSDPKEHLSRILVERGLVDQATMARALKLQEATQILLGRVLVTLGSLGEGDLRRILQTKTEETVYNLFSWSEGDFRFVGDAVPEQPMIPISLDVTNLVLEGMHRIDELRQNEPPDDPAASDLPPEVLETQIIAPITDLPAPEATDSAFMEEAAPSDEPTAEEETPETVEEAPSPEVAEVATIAAAEGSGEIELPVTEPESAEAGSYYQSIPSEKMSRESLYGLLAGALVLILVVIGGVLYFKNDDKAPEGADPIQVAELDATSGSATGQPTEPESGELEAGLLTGEPGETVDDGADGTAPVTGSAEPAADRDDTTSTAELEARAQQLAEARAAAREQELRREYESELETLRAQLEEANQGAETETETETEAEAGAGAEPIEEPESATTGSPGAPTQGFATEPGATQVAEGQVPPGQSPPEQPNQAGTPDAETPPPAATPAPPQPEPEPEPPSVQRGDLVEFGAGVTQPAMLQPPKPRYPPAARRMRREAVADLRVLVDEEGNVEDVERTGKKLGMGFDQAAEDAARRTTWRPASKDGVAVKMWVSLRIEFKP